MAMLRSVKCFYMTEYNNNTQHSIVQVIQMNDYFKYMCIMQTQCIQLYQAFIKINSCSHSFFIVFIYDVL